MNLTNNNNSVVRPVVDLRRPRGERPVIKFGSASTDERPLWQFVCPNGKMAVYGHDGGAWSWTLVCPNTWAVSIGDHTVGVIIHDLQRDRWLPFFNGGERPSCGTFAEALKALQSSWAV